MDVREGWAVDEHGPDGVEEDLESAEECLAQQGVEEECFQGCWEIGIQTRDTEGFVVRQVIWLFGRPLINPFQDMFRRTQWPQAHPKRSTIRQPNRQIGKDGKQPVRQRRPECQVMRDLMDREEEVLVRRCANNIRGHQEPPIQHRRVAQEIGTQDLQGDDAQDNIFREWFGAAELGYLQRYRLACRQQTALRRERQQ